MLKPKSEPPSTLKDPEPQPGSLWYHLQGHGYHQKLSSKKISWISPTFLLVSGTLRPLALRFDRHFPHTIMILAIFFFHGQLSPQGTHKPPEDRGFTSSLDLLVTVSSTQGDWLPAVSTVHIFQGMLPALLGSGDPGAKVATC